MYQCVIGGGNATGRITYKYFTHSKVFVSILKGREVINYCAPKIVKE